MSEEPRFSLFCVFLLAASGQEGTPLLCKRHITLTRAPSLSLLLLDVFNGRGIHVRTHVHAQTHTHKLKQCLMDSFSFLFLQMSLKQALPNTLA
jgi:hypothetical protein